MDQVALDRDPNESYFSGKSSNKKEDTKCLKIYSHGRRCDQIPRHIVDL